MTDRLTDRQTGRGSVMTDRQTDRQTERGRGSAMMTTLSVCCSCNLSSCSLTLSTAFCFLIITLTDTHTHTSLTFSSFNSHSADRSGLEGFTGAKDDGGGEW